MPAMAREPAPIEEEPPASDVPASNAGVEEPLEIKMARGLPNILENADNVVRAWIKIAPQSACCDIFVFVLGLGVDLGMWASSPGCVTTMMPLQPTVGGGVHGADITRCVRKPVIAAHTRWDRLFYTGMEYFMGGGSVVRVVVAPGMARIAKHARIPSLAC